MASNEKKGVAGGAMGENTGWFARLMKAGRVEGADPQASEAGNGSSSADHGPRQPRLTITERRGASVAILDLEGLLTLGHGVRDLHAAIRSLLERGERRILLNYDLTYIDSAGLAELINAYVTVRSHGGTIKISNAAKRIGSGATVIATLLAVFETYDDEAQAVASFEGQNAAAAPLRA